MMKIFKYPLIDTCAGLDKFHTGPGACLVDLDLPLGAQVLSAGLQGRQIVVWAMVDSTEERRAVRKFRVLFTGATAETVTGSDGLWMRHNFLATIQTVGGGMEIVFHVFELV